MHNVIEFVRKGHEPRSYEEWRRQRDEVNRDAHLEGLGREAKRRGIDPAYLTLSHLLPSQGVA